MTYANRKINIKQSLMHPIPCNCNLHNTEVLEWYLFWIFSFSKNKYDWTKCYINRPKVHHETHPLNGPLSGTTQVSRYHKGKTNLDFTEARDSEWQWHQLSRMQVCTSLQTDNHASTPPLSFYRPDALPATKPTVSKHWRHYERKSKTENGQQ